MALEPSRPEHSDNASFDFGILVVVVELRQGSGPGGVVSYAA